jgi:hypothetical protein
MDEYFAWKMAMEKLGLIVLACVIGLGILLYVGASVSLWFMKRRRKMSK